MEILDESSINSLSSFWKKQAISSIKWINTFSHVLLPSKIQIQDRFEFLSRWKWFDNGTIDIKSTFFKGKLLDKVFITAFDISHNCRNITYREFLYMCFPTISELKKSQENIKVMIIGRASPETSALMISTALVGGCHSVLFEDLSYEAIVSRIEIFKPTHIYINSGVDIEKINNLSENFPSLFQKTYQDYILINDSHKEDLLDSSLIYCDESDVYKSIPKVSVESLNYLFCLFTSGSTGKPKAIWHSYAGYLVYAAYSFKEYFTNAGAVDSIFCATDAAWINGHTYAVYGPLMKDTRTIFMQDLSNLQRPDILSIFLNITQPQFLYSSVTLLRAIRSYSILLGSSCIQNQSYKIIGLGSCGEPLAHDVGSWALDYFNSVNKYIVNTYFQTETGGVLVAPRSQDSLIKDHSTVGKSQFPLEISISKNDNNLVIKRPWPGCFSMVTSDKEPNYWDQNGNYLLHDLGHEDDESFLYIGGRSDDVINISGHRVSTAEIESTFLSFDTRISESAAVELNDDITGSKLALFYVLASKEDQDLEPRRIKSFLSSKLSTYHKPWKVIRIGCLPKTKSGKIARRLLKYALSKNKPKSSDDLSTITNYREFLVSLEKL